jgi:hypothetical protein
LDVFLRDLKAHVRSLLADIDVEKIRLFKNSKILSCIAMVSKSLKSPKFAFEKVKRIVEEIRRELPQIDSISLSGAKKKSICPQLGLPYAVIDIRANGIDFQIELFLSVI